MCIPTTNYTHITNTIYYFLHKIPIHIESANDIFLTTAKDLNASLCQLKKTLLPPPDTQTCHALVKLNAIFFNVTKPAEATRNDLPRVILIKIKTAADLPRVPPITTTGFY